MEKRKRKQILLKCCQCNEEYFKDLSEYKRNLEKGRKSFCSFLCSFSYNRKNHAKNKNRYDISKHSGNKADSLTDFRYFIKMLNNKNRGKEVTITLEELKLIWENQKGICPYTKIKLIPQTHTMSHTKYPFYTRASVDRINSSKGYTFDNIEFVSLAINFLKNKYSKEEVFDFLKIIKNLELDA